MNDNKGLAEVKPCPFCGATKGYVECIDIGLLGVEAEYAAICDCGARGPEIVCDPSKPKRAEKLARAAWNRRTPEAVAARGEGVWVSVEERLPEWSEGTQCLIYHPDRHFLRLTSEHPSWWNLKDKRGPEFDGERVSHWCAVTYPTAALLSAAPSGGDEGA